MPPNTVSVTRPGKWGNPFRIGGYFQLNVGAFSWLEVIPELGRNNPAFVWIETSTQAVQLFRRYAEGRKAGAFEPLRGINLACWCKIGDPCHADVLLELANAPEVSEHQTDASAKDAGQRSALARAGGQ